VTSEWEEGAVVKGHLNICPLLDFFEDAHFYYLVLPSTSPPPGPDGVPLPSDLFDLVEMYPEGLPAHLIRSYLGQIADALCFLHSKGIGEYEHGCSSFCGFRLLIFIGFLGSSS
jgi:serine/threonine protein kinase